MKRTFDSNPLPIARRAQSIIAADSMLSELAVEAERAAGGDPGHDLAHCLRVADWSLILIEEAIDPRAIIAAALLHDIVNVPKNAPDRAEASARSASRAVEMLVARGFSESEALTISAAIRDHSFSRGATPEGALGRALQDADRLDSLGAMGILRTVSTGTRMGSAYCHASDPWAEARELDDARFMIDHFARKLLRLPDLMLTERARAEAHRRRDFLLHFLDEVAIEIGRPRP
ncbi:MAG TPA: HD domain-containing protein [Polyangiaceae bacterium]|jgi:uncharacterized protein